MIQLNQYLRIVRTSAWYDLVATIGFATPWTFALIHNSLSGLIQILGLPGEFPTFEPTHILMANLLGSIVIIWAILRIRAPIMKYGRYDAIVRFLFATWQIYAFAHGANAIILVFAAFDIGFGIAESLSIKAPRFSNPSIKARL